jgi:hypothetical protein
MRQGLFEVFGSGRLGLKADDLNQFAELITSAGMYIPEGIVLATGVFDQLIGQIEADKTPEVIEALKCPDFFLSIINEILDKLEIGKPYAIRSSALSERGGTGIYKSVFFQATGDRDEDLQNFWHCVTSVYASEFTSDAKLWRARNKAEIGMAILIQPAVGKLEEGNYFPTLAGTAYTSYNGLPTIRVVVGLGTRAVNAGGIIFNCPPENFQRFQRSLWDQDRADAISPAGMICEIHTQTTMIHTTIARVFETFTSLFEKLSKLREQGNFYLEWAISGGKTFVVQCASYDDCLPGEVSFDSKNYFMLLKAEDILHSGHVTCQSIVYVRRWSPKVADTLEGLNEISRNYLLIVPQDALSLLADVRLSFRHFSNALAVVEKQWTYTAEQRLMLSKAGLCQADHTSGKGASHFSQLCNRAKILFLGGEFVSTPLLRLPGGIDVGDNTGITAWKTKVEVVVDAIKKEGHVYVSKETKKSDYSLYQVNSWSDALRTTANALNASGEVEVSGAFYTVHYAIGPDEDPTQFDPFKLDETIVAEFGIPDIVASLKVVIANGERFLGSDVWNGKLKEFLQDLLQRLE